MSEDMLSYMSTHPAEPTGAETCAACRYYKCGACRHDPPGMDLDYHGRWPTIAPDEPACGRFLRRYRG